MDTLNQLYLGEIQKMLFQTNDFMSTATSHDAFVKNKSINIPSVDITANLLKNPTGKSSSDATRADKNIKYDLNYLALQPIPIQYDEEMFTEYDMLNSTSDYVKSRFEDGSGTQVIAEWAQGLTSSHFIEATGATISRNGVTRPTVSEEDILELALKMDEDNIPQNERYLMLPSILFRDLFGTDKFINKDYIVDANAVKMGVITELYGFKILKRNIVVEMEGADVLDYFDQTDGGHTTNKLGAIAYHKGSVAKAYNGIEIFTTVKDPDRYGASVLNGGIIVAGSRTRYDQKGVYVLTTSLT